MGIQFGNGVAADGYATSQMMFFNKLNNGSYNGIVKAGDQALIFTDGMNSDGSNQDGGMVLAPWGSQGGLRLDPMGNMELRGDLRSTKVVVDAVWWPDFVFEKSYSLRPLEEVKSYIETHKHLPDMPSETVVKSQGQNMGELQKLQQQKIEELTLYTIQQEEKLKAQAAKIAEMEQKLDLLLNPKK